MSMQAIPEIANAIKDVSWRWSKEGVEECIHSLGWHFIERVLHRQEYLVTGDIQASVFFQESECIAIEIDLDVFLHSDALSQFDYDEKVDEYFAKYEQAVLLAEKVLGQPLFNDGAAARGFPEDEDAVWLTLWKFPTCRLMIQLRHEDRGLPFRLSIVITPPG